MALRCSIVLSTVAGLLLYTGSGWGAGAADYRWRSAAIGGGGFVTGLSTHTASGRVYAFTDVGGAYAWLPGDTQWTPLLDSLITDPADFNLYGVEDIAADPTDATGNTLWVALGKYGGWGDCCGLFRSTNGGASFQRRYPAAGAAMNISSSDPRRRQGPRFAIDPNNGQVVLYGTRSEGLKITTDGGAHWTSAAGFPAGVGDINAVVFDPSSGVDANSRTQGIWAGVGIGTGAGLYHRTSTSGSFTKITYPNGFNTALQLQHAAMDAVGNLFITFAQYGGEPDSPSGGGVWKVSASGQFTNVTPVTGRAYIGIDVVAGSSGSSAKVVVIESCGNYRCPVYVSTNGGTSYTTYGRSGIVEAVVDGESAPWFTSPGDTNASAWSAYPAAIVWDPSDTLHTTVLLSDYFGVWKGVGVATPSIPVFHNLAANHEEIEPYQLSTPPLVAGGSAARLLTASVDVDGFRSIDPAIMPTRPFGPFINATAVQTYDRVADTSGIDYYELDAMHLIRVGVPGGSGAKAASFSTDNGQTWSFYTTVPSVQAGRIALAPRANPAAAVAVWAPRGASAGVYYSTTANTAAATWLSAAGAPTGAMGAFSSSQSDPKWNYNEPLAADRYAGTAAGDCSTTWVGCVFYLYKGGALYRSRDRGANWASVYTFPSGAGTNAHPWVRVAGNPYASAVGEVWVSIADEFYSQGVTSVDGLYRSTNAANASGVAFTRLANVNAAYLFALGPPVTSGSSYALYLYGRLAASPSVAAVYRSDDQGANWLRIYDPTVNTPVGIADYPVNMAAERAGPTPGGLYIGTNGRGVVYGEYIQDSNDRIFSNGFDG